MLFWSKGLGKRGNIVIACGSEKVKKERNALVLMGETLPPIRWSYTMTMEEKDFIAILRLGLSKTFLIFLLRPKRIKYAIKLLFLFIKFLIKFIFSKIEKEELKKELKISGEREEREEREERRTEIEEERYEGGPKFNQGESGYKSFKKG